MRVDLHLCRGDLLGDRRQSRHHVVTPRPHSRGFSVQRLQSRRVTVDFFPNELQLTLKFAFAQLRRLQRLSRLRQLLPQAGHEAAHGRHHGLQGAVMRANRLDLTLQRLDFVLALQHRGRFVGTAAAPNQPLRRDKFAVLRGKRDVRIARAQSQGASQIRHNQHVAEQMVD